MAASGRSLGRPRLFQVGPEGRQVAPGGLKSVLGGATWSLGPTYPRLTCNLPDFGHKRPAFYSAFSSLFRPSIFDQSFDVILGRFGVSKRVQNGSKIDFEIVALIVRRSEYVLEGT